MAPNRNQTGEPAEQQGDGYFIKEEVLDLNCLSSRSRHLVTQDDPVFRILMKMKSNEFSSNNRTGSINFCGAEDVSCKDLMGDFLTKNKHLFVPPLDDVCHYAAPGGFDRTRAAIAEYLSVCHNFPIDQSSISTLPSGNSAYDLLAHCLLEANDTVITQYPAYCRNRNSLYDRALCKMEGVQIDLNEPRLVVEDYAAKVRELTKQGERVGALILINPNNPLGIVYPTEDVIALSNWATRNGLWVIVDETFAMTTHADTEKYRSFLTYQHSLNRPDRTIVFRSLGKEYGVPGLKLCMLRTPNPIIHQAFNRLEVIHPVSHLAQSFFINFVKETDFLQSFLVEKEKRLMLCRRFLERNLTSMGIPFVTANSGFFLFANFQSKMREITVDEEMRLWEDLVNRKGVYLTPGSHTGNEEPGWFRLAYACNGAMILEGIRRLHEYFGCSTMEGELDYHWAK